MTKKYLEPLYRRWRTLKNSHSLSQEWRNFGNYLADVNNTFKSGYVMRRIDRKKVNSFENSYWMKPVGKDSYVREIVFFNEEHKKLMLSKGLVKKKIIKGAKKQEKKAYENSSFLSVNADGSEHWHSLEPYKRGTSYISDGEYNGLPKGTIEILTGIALKWEDEPINISDLMTSNLKKTFL